ncbi:MAG: transglutaminase domain-containing protein [Clostridia bacterium]|nr:transglutaminase domain-containing protein [Clostridia bacterium]
MLVKKMAALSANLPEDIMKKKWAGDYEGAIELIDYRLKTAELTQTLRDRLEIEKQIIQRLPGEYPIPRDEAIRIVQERIPDFTEEEFHQLELDGALDYMYVHGERHYYRRFLRTLLHVNPMIQSRAGVEPDPEDAMLDETIASLKKNKTEKWHIHIKHEMQVRDSAFIPGETYLAHLPLPMPCAQTDNIRLIDIAEDAVIAPEDYPQRTASFVRRQDTNGWFSVEYEYDNVARYVDITKAPEGAMPVYPNAAPVCPADLAEQAPHICFTTYLKSLAAEIKGDLEKPVDIVRAIYKYVTSKVKYTFMREYFTVENGSEYAALNKKGDCGIQTLLFITLCRICGIPARWQAGLYTPADGIGNHDWAQFYVEPFGWLFCDCSFGGSAWRAGNMERWEFYLGNLDPYRMVCNSAYQQSFYTPKQHMRIDPYDNQCGECECGAKGFSDPELSNYNFTLMELMRID